LVFDRRRTVRLLARYRLMFRVSLSTLCLSIFVLAASLVAWMVGPMPVSLPFALLMIELSGLCAYKVLTSTVRVLESDRAGS
jgi:hypothetical protein